MAQLINSLSAAILHQLQLLEFKIPLFQQLLKGESERNNAGKDLQEQNDDSVDSVKKT